MVIQILVNSVDVTDKIIVDSLTKEDVINDEKDTMRFRVLKYASQGFTPLKNQEVELNIDSTKEFGGVIVSIVQSIEAGNIVVYNVTCSDFSFQLDQKIANERYDDVAVDLIISDLVTTYASTFTTSNVAVSTVVKTMSFNRVTLSQAIEKIARATGNSWYVDVNKDIHFFPKSQRQAPFMITDSNENYIQGTLLLDDDLSQLRNVVIIRGDEERGVARTEIQSPTTEDQIIFNLGNKFAEKPQAFLDTGGGTSSITLGVDFLTAEADADAFWNFQGKYIRFKGSTAPSSGHKIDISGIPLFPILVQVKDGPSIAEFGEYQFFKEDKTIKSRSEAIAYAEAELDSYSKGVVEGRFSTNVLGLRSGQQLRINSGLLGIDEQFLIQKVSFRVLAKDKGQWDVELATLRTVGIIQVLQDLLRFREVREFDPDNILTLIQEEDTSSLTDSIVAPLATTSPPYEYVADTEEANPGQYNFATYF